MKTLSPKLKAYKTAKADYAFASETVSALKSVGSELGILAVGASLSISYESSDKQFIYGIGIINQQLTACHELGMSDEEYRQVKATIIQMSEIRTQLQGWKVYARELCDYCSDVYNLLSDDELFTLLEKPTKL